MLANFIKEKSITIFFFEILSLHVDLALYPCFLHLHTYVGLEHKEHYFDLMLLSTEIQCDDGF